MRIYIYSLLALLPLLGLPLSATACGCNHTDDADAGLHSVSCCQDLAASCCVQQHRETEPKQPLYMVAPQNDSLSVILAVVTTLTEERAIQSPHAGIVFQRARPPPLQRSEYRCRLQTWLV